MTTEFRLDRAAEPLQVTIKEAARLLSFDERTIRRLIVRGEIQAIGHGRLRRISFKSLHDYQQRHQCSA
jgi:excisionase family DNA binding protein